MFTQFLKKTIVYINLMVVVLLQAACSENQDAASEQGVVISGSISDNSSAAMSKMSQKNSVLSIADYEVYCLTFESEPYSARSLISSGGSFSLRMPAQTPFGCFINHTESQVPVATIAIAGEGESFGDSASTALQFRGDVNFGELSLDLSRAQVLIPRTVVEDVVVQEPSSSLNLADMANQSYLMTCLPSGNTWLDQACQTHIANDDGDGDIFFRMMSATRNGEAIHGIGVWESEQAFLDCGGIDLMDSAVADLGTDEGLLFDLNGVASGASFNVGAQCPLRDSAQPASHENLELYYAAGELVADGQGWTLYAHDRHLANAGCEIENTTVVHFTGDNADRLVGQFMTVERNIDLNNGLGDCSHLTDQAPLSFTVEFVKQ